MKTDEETPRKPMEPTRPFIPPPAPPGSIQHIEKGPAETTKEPKRRRRFLFFGERRSGK